jgi:hypothetical protein
VLASFVLAEVANEHAVAGAEVETDERLKDVKLVVRRRGVPRIENAGKHGSYAQAQIVICRKRHSARTKGESGRKRAGCQRLWERGGKMRRSSSGEGHRATAWDSG